MKRILLLVFCCVLCSQTIWAARARVEDLAQDPYISAMVIDADTGKVLFGDHTGTVVYPASVLKMMDLLVILEQIEQGKLRLTDMVQVTREAAHMGGSQVYLDPSEQFSVEDLLYALAVQSANDAAVALAIHVAGSTEGFVSLMNQKAAELGMKDTRFYSVHGLPPAKGQKPDRTTARDLALLSRELAKRTDIFLYTGTRERPFRDGKFVMRNHNHLLGKFAGCDGFKTGYFRAAGFSIVATAKRDEVRIIAIVMGSRDRKTRDVKAAELLAKGFALMPAKPEVAAVVNKPEPIPAVQAMTATPEPEQLPSPTEQRAAESTTESGRTGGGWGVFFLGLGVGLGGAGMLAVYLSKKKSRKRSGLYRQF